MSLGTLFLLIVVGVFALKAYAGHGGGGETHHNTPRPHTSSVCNQYFKGGC